MITQKFIQEIQEIVIKQDALLAAEGIKQGESSDFQHGFDEGARWLLDYAKLRIGLEYPDCLKYLPENSENKS